MYTDGRNTVFFIYHKLITFSRLRFGGATTTATHTTSEVPKQAHETSSLSPRLHRFQPLLLWPLISTSDPSIFHSTPPWCNMVCSWINQVGKEQPIQKVEVSSSSSLPLWNMYCLSSLQSPWTWAPCWLTHGRFWATHHRIKFVWYSHSEIFLSSKCLHGERKGRNVLIDASIDLNVG